MFLGSVRHKFVIYKSDWDGYIIPHTVTASQTDKIFATLWFMKKEAYAESTVQAVGRRLARASIYELAL